MGVLRPKVPATRAAVRLRPVHAVRSGQLPRAYGRLDHRIMQLDGGVSPETSTAARGGLVMAVRSLLSTLVCASTVVACSATAGAEPAGATCEQFQSTPSIQQARATAAGADLTIVLCSNPSTGYSWGEPQIGDASVLKLVDRTVRAPAEASLPIVGAAGAEVLTLRGETAGTTTLSIGYGQPWAGGAQGEWTYRLDVTVR